MTRLSSSVSFLRRILGASSCGGPSAARSAPGGARSAALIAGSALVIASTAAAQTVLPPDPGLDYLPLDFGTASTFLTGIRGANIVGNSVIPDTGETGGLYYDSTSGDWSAFPEATANGANYPGAVGSSPYGPSFGSPGGVLRVVGSFKTDASPDDLGYLYDGAAAPGTDPLTLVYPDPDIGFTIAHSTFGDTVVGNYDTGPLTGNAFIYDIRTGAYVTNNRRGAISTTAYGVWGDKVAGGYGDFGPEGQPGFEHGYIYDMRTERWSTHDHPDAIFTHFEGITGGGRGGAYNLVVDWIDEDGLHAGVLQIDAEGNETWHEIAYPGADTTTANSIHQDRVIGVYTDANGEHGFEVTIPGIYNPIVTRDRSSSADNVTLYEGAPGDDVVNSANIVTTGDFANAIRVDRYGVVYNSGTVQVSGATAGAVALRGRFPSLINSGVLQAAAAGDAVRADANARGSLIVNTGTGVIDGRIDVRARGNARFENSGLIGMSEPGAGLSSVVSGVFVQTADGVYAPRVGGDAADSIAVLGTARLAGALNPAIQPGALVRDYTLLSVTGERTGRFETFAPTGLPTFVDARAAYSEDGVDLALTAEIAETTGLDDNEQAVALALDDAFNAGPGGIPEELNAALFSLSSADLPDALDALSGEVYASEQAALIDGAVFTREAILGRLRQEAAGFGAPVAGSGILTFAPTEGPAGRGVTLWGQALGARVNMPGTSDASGADTDFAGVFGGVDMRVGARSVIGFAAGYTWSDTSIDGGGGSADADSLLVAGYGGASRGPWSLRGGLSYAMSSIDASRTAGFPGFSDSLEASYDATTAQIFGEVGYAIERGGVAIEPFLGLAWVHLDTDGFTETGGAAALSAEDETSTVGYSTLGVRAGRSFGVGGAGGARPDRAMTFSPHLSLAWRRAWGDLSTSASLAFAEMTAQGFSVSGVALAEDTGILDVGFDLAVNPRATLGFAYLGQFSDGPDTNSLRATLAWAF